VDFVRPVGEAGDELGFLHAPQRHLIGHAQGTVHLDGPANDFMEELLGGDLGVGDVITFSKAP
jgi:hypothetical protein